MAWQAQSCQEAGEDALGQLRGFRRDVYRRLWRRADALFETMDAVLTAPSAAPLGGGGGRGDRGPDGDLVLVFAEAPTHHRGGFQV
jgi:hypothetical protein